MKTVKLSCFRHLQEDELFKTGWADKRKRAKTWLATEDTEVTEKGKNKKALKELFNRDGQDEKDKDEDNGFLVKKYPVYHVYPC